MKIKREQVNDSVSKRRAAGIELSGRRASFTESEIRNAQRLIESGQEATPVLMDLGMSRATLYRRVKQLGDPR